jgi:chitinase
MRPVETCGANSRIIHYTINGAAPTKASPVFGNAIAVSKTTTIKAIAVAVGDYPSVVSAATYTINAK